MPTLRIDVGGLEKADTALRRFARTVDDLRPFWRELGQTLADDAQSRWPLKRRTGRLRKSLVWAGSRLGRFGVFESSPDLLQFGSAVFYAICSIRDETAAGDTRLFTLSIQNSTASS